jgi:membrane-bound metal-dependent hydrolase YbcI (DUF457 family)
MFIFAHVFLGALIGLGFWHLTHDRRALPLCIVGAIFPDLLDKSLALLMPDLLGSGRTIGHSLLFLAIMVVSALILWKYRHTLLGLACTCAVFSHQILDAMWSVPSTWYFPLMGPFSVFIIPDYVGHYFWLEVFNLSEWVFAGASLFIIMLWYLSMPEPRVIFQKNQRIRTVRILTAILLGGMGLYLLFFGVASIPYAFFAPTYNPITDVMAGVLALCGTLVLVKWSGIPCLNGD